VVEVAAPAPAGAQPHAVTDAQLVLGAELVE
jgi:hypothetical protein